MSREPKTDDRMVAALLRERDSYQRQNLPDRVAQVEEQLRLRGWVDPTPDKPAPAEPEDKGAAPDAPAEPEDKGTADSTPPKGRRGAPRRTA